MTWHDKGGKGGKAKCDFCEKGRGGSGHFQIYMGPFINWSLSSNYLFRIRDASAEELHGTIPPPLACRNSKVRLVKQFSHAEPKD